MDGLDGWMDGWTCKQFVKRGILLQHKHMNPLCIYSSIHTNPQLATYLLQIVQKMNAIT